MRGRWTAALVAGAAVVISVPAAEAAKPVLPVPHAVAGLEQAASVGSDTAQARKSTAPIFTAYSATLGLQVWGWCDPDGETWQIEGAGYRTLDLWDGGMIDLGGGLEYFPAEHIYDAPFADGRYEIRNGVAPFTFAAPDLPAGFTFDSDDGELHWNGAAADNDPFTYDTVGSYTFTVVITDSSSQTLALPASVRVINYPDLPATC